MINTRILVTAALLLSAASHANADLIDEFCAPPRPCLCEDWDTQQENSYIIENNVWNKGDIRNYRQCVFIENNTSNITAGWVWQWPENERGVVAFPTIIHGKKPWFDNSSNPYLPKKVSEIPCLQVSYDIDQSAQGVGNLAFDLWLTDNSAALPENITREVMIWISDFGMTPAGSLIDAIEVGGHTVEVWKNDNHGDMTGLIWTYFAFVFKPELLKGTLYFSDFLNYLVSQSLISGDEYLATTDLGNEIEHGSGETLLNSYEITVCEDSSRLIFYDGFESVSDSIP